MGYSIGVRCRSKALQKRMLDFLSTHFRAYAGVLGQGEDEPRYISDPTEDLGYEQAWSVGFNYGAWGSLDFERTYYWAALRWMALKVSRRRRHFGGDFSELELSEAVPYTVYDGGEAWPVLLKKPRKQYLWCWYDQLGFQRDPLVEGYRHVALLLEKGVLRVSGKSCEPQWSAEALKVVEKLPQSVVSDPFQVRGALVQALCKEQLSAGLAPLRAEIQRLDGLWNG